jgi:hypothetical protein
MEVRLLQTEDTGNVGTPFGIIIVFVNGSQARVVVVHGAAGDLWMA